MARFQVPKRTIEWLVVLAVIGAITVVNTVHRVTHRIERTLHSLMRH